MLGQSGEFYHALTKRYTAIFGTLFNNIYISRSDGTTTTQDFKVPIGFGPREKYLGRIKEDPDAVRDRAIEMPRMSFELLNMVYDSSRALNPGGSSRRNVGSASFNVLNPVPFNLSYELTIMTKTLEDGYKIVEQIVPFFRPDISVTAHLLDQVPDDKRDISIVLNSVNHSDSYEDSFEKSRLILWTLSFTLKGWYFTGIPTAKVIKFATVDLYPDLVKTPVYAKVETYPGLTANGQPTTDPTEAVPFTQVNETDDWDYIIITEDVSE